MRLFALSIKPHWHGACVPATLMAQGRITFAALIAVNCILVLPYQVPAQPSTAPPSPLATRPLVPGSTESGLRPSCDRCRKPDTWAGSDIKRFDFAVRTDYVRTRMRGGPLAHWTKTSRRRCLAGHSCPQKFRRSGIRKQGTINSLARAKKGNSKSTINAELPQSLEDAQRKPRSPAASHSVSGF